MGVEIERKYLIRDIQALKKAAEQGWHVLIEQGYLNLDKSRAVRIRICTPRDMSPHETPEAFITIKGKADGLARPEFEYPIPYEDAQELLKMVDGRIITKVRVEIGNWEVDFFSEDYLGLIVAEIELSKADESIELPDWIGEEVSEEKLLSNISLAKNSPELVDKYKQKGFQVLGLDV
jgi:CYTH domain-containing protein